MTFPQQRRNPKIQRGISLRPEIYERIQQDAERLGLRFNDVVERILQRAFEGDVQTSHASRHESLVLMEVEDDE